uniref:Cyclic nucleotide-binding domain-containing protein n=1 Tax=Roseihalotalea indica TaxID=2867963 RepID=A0AA49JGE3_9BACT|nr:cyclic nucleotide-binding domain-containing protein [Tunicatimonas sp. TK19036]
MRNPFQRSFSEQELELITFLSKFQLFEQLTQEEMSTFFPYMYLRRYQENEVVFFRKDPSHALYLINSGKIALLIDQDQDFETLNVISAGQSFGNNSLLQSTLRPYSAIVRSVQAELYVIPHVNIQDIFSSHPKIKAKMMASLGEMYEAYLQDLFHVYRSAKGFFNLNQVSANI